MFAISQLSAKLQSIMGKRVQALIKRFTSNTLSSVVVGIVLTTLLGSSSALIIIAIILVNSKALTFKQAMGIVLGANIGTTVSSQIIAMDIGKYSPILLVIGLILVIASKSKKFKDTGHIILYFGMLFFGLFTMESSVEPLRDEAFFTAWMKRTENPVIGAMVGAFVTLIIQSSSATVGMAILLSKKGLITLTGGIAVMLGAELGTCSDTLIATINGTKAALKTGIFHVTFNLLSIVLGLILFYPFMSLVEYISTGAPIERTVANAHMLFNILGAFIFVWTIPLFETVLNRLLPDSKVPALD